MSRFEYKDIILLAKSEKHSNYCIAGFEISTRKWVRVVSADEKIHYSIKQDDMFCTDGSEANVLDIIRVYHKGKSESYYQPENHFIDSKYCLNKVGKYNINNLVNLCDSTNEIFYSTENRVSEDLIKKVSPEKAYSLTMIRLEWLLVKMHNKKKGRLEASFMYKSKLYSCITITDVLFNNKYIDNFDDFSKEVRFNNIIILISLGELFKGYHYKLISAVFEL